MLYTMHMELSEPSSRHQKMYFYASINRSWQMHDVLGCPSSSQSVCPSINTHSAWHKYSSCELALLNSFLKWEVKGPLRGPHWPLITLPLNSYHPKWLPVVNIKVKCHFTAEIVRMWNSSSSFGDVILNILNFPQLKQVFFAMRRLNR